MHSSHLHRNICIHLEWKHKLSILQFFLKFTCELIYMWIKFLNWKIKIHPANIFWLFLKKRLYLLIFREKRQEGETSMYETNIDWLPPALPQLGTRPTTQACALAGNWTSSPSVCRPALNPLKEPHKLGFFIIIIFIPHFSSDFPFVLSQTQTLHVILLLHRSCCIDSLFHYYTSIKGSPHFCFPAIFPRVNIQQNVN